MFTTARLATNKLRTRSVGSFWLRRELISTTGPTSIQAHHAGNSNRAAAITRGRERQGLSRRIVGGVSLAVAAGSGVAYASGDSNPVGGKSESIDELLGGLEKIETFLDMEKRMDVAEAKIESQILSVQGANILQLRLMALPRKPPPTKLKVALCQIRRRGQGRQLGQRQSCHRPRSQGWRKVSFVARLFQQSLCCDGFSKICRGCSKS